MVKTNPGEIRYPARQDPAQGVGHADDGHQERCVLHADTVLGKNMKIMMMMLIKMILTMMMAMILKLTY